MKIAVISDTFYPQVNGVSNTLSKMAAYMDKNQIDYRFYVPKWEDRQDTDTDRIQRFEALKPWLYPECRLAIPHRNNYQSIKESLEEFRPDLLHIATEFSLGYMGLKYAKESGIPMVMSYHTDIPAYLKHYKLQLMEKAVWAYFRWFHASALLNLVPSNATMLQLKEQGFENLAYWKRGIDNERFSPAYRSEALRKEIMREDSMLMLYVGRISAEKEIDVLFNAIEILSNQNLSVKLAVVGDGPYRQELESRGFSNVTFLGYKTGKELQRIYASSDIFVFPSSSETYGNVILEAMASGLPVVAPYAGGIKENLIHEQNGLAFKTGDAADMAQKIKMVLKDQNLRDRLAVNARKSIERKTWDSIFSELFNCYAAVLDQQKPVVKRIA